MEAELQRVGRSIHAAFPTRPRHPLRALDLKAMEMAADDEELRAALFRFVDVTPACTNLDDLARHLTAYLGEVDERPPPIEAAMRISGTKAGRAALGAAAAAGVRHMAHRFIVGETPRAGLRHIRQLWSHGAAVSLDLLGEATVTQPEADRYAARCLDALDTLAEAAPRWPARPVLEQDSLGGLPRVNVSVKVSALTPLLRPEAPEVGRDDAARRMRPLLLRAKELGAHLHIDMESVDTLEATMRLVFDLLDEPELRDGPSTGIVLQAYLRESPEQLEQVIAWAQSARREQPLVVRLVKGAYWDHEVVEARQHGWTPPVFEEKADSDRNFERLTRRLLEGWPHVRPAIASHNLRSVAHAVAANRAAGRADHDLELQVLRGLGDDLAAALAGQGMRVRIYCPVGDMVAGMAYLVRRLLENTANESFLSDLQRGVSVEELLEALRDLDAKLPLAVPVLIGGERGANAGLDSTDPGAPERLVAQAGRAGAAEAAAAVETAQRGFREWGARSAAERAQALRGAAARLRERRLELAALQVRECAKPWPEADADVCEAIDFLEYYALAALELDSGHELIQVPGERNRMRYAPRGVAAVIAPWNFPLAIPCGMTAAALAVGNAAVLKPAEQSPASAGALVDALHEGGVPYDALALLPGHGDAGAALVSDPRVHVIAFTGSSAVGLDILRESAQTPDGQGHVKRVVSEMGGKNCVIVDADADLDEAVPGIVQSAFAYAGQKCSAAARVLVHEAIGDTLVQRLAGATEVLRVGQADEFATEVPPVIEREAQERVLRYAEIAEREGRIVARATPVPGSGWFCPPAIAVELAEGSAVNQEEIFGPLLSVTTVTGVEEACDIVDALPFALTGGLFSRNPETVERVAARLPVGNLYVNRGITGAMVGRQPFGGNRRSGIGAKAGGPDYLLQFVEPRVVTENTMRQGIAVE